jgi:hypothetical protein
MIRKLLALLALCVSLSSCDMVSSMKESVAQSNEAAVAIEKQVGAKPQVGFNYNNGSFTAVTVQFATMPSASLAEVEKIARAAVVAAFKKEPENLVISFVFKKSGA